MTVTVCDSVGQVL